MPILSNSCKIANIESSLLTAELDTALYLIYNKYIPQGRVGNWVGRITRSLSMDKRRGGLQRWQEKEES